LVIHNVHLSGATHESYGIHAECSGYTKGSKIMPQSARDQCFFITLQAVAITMAECNIYGWMLSVVIGSQPRLLYYMHIDRLVRGLSHDIVHLFNKLNDSSLVDSSHSFSHVDYVRGSVKSPSCCAGTGTLP